MAGNGVHQASADCRAACCRLRAKGGKNMLVSCANLRPVDFGNENTNTQFKLGRHLFDMGKSKEEALSRSPLHLFFLSPVDRVP